MTINAMNFPPNWRRSVNLFRICAAGLLVILFASCSSAPRIADEADTAEVEIAVAEQVRLLLNQASTSESPDRDQLYLQAAGLLANNNELDWARNLLRSIDPDLLFVEDFVEYTLIYSFVAIETDAYFLAQRILTNPRVEQQWQSFSEEDAKLLRERRAELFSLLGESNKSVYERVQLSQLSLEPDAIVENQDALWENLMAMSAEDLAALSIQEQDTTLRGWYALARISKSSDEDLERQLTNVEQWIRDWPNHPASLFMPSDLQLLQQLVSQQPNSVALLLPLSHEADAYRIAARQLRDGFMAAYFQTRQNGSRVPQIRVFDTSRSDINSVYDAAVADGAEFIVGPLLRENVSELSLRIDLPVPTLALNDFESPYAVPDNFYQFSLNPESDAQQVAERAWLEGHRRALILVPKDTATSSIGSRSARAFTDTFEQLGGHVVQRTYFTEPLNYSSDIETGLLINESEERRQRISRAIGSSTEFEPRRRKDLDFVFLVANTREAQGIKPTLKLHRAADVPVFATSRVYTGLSEAKYRDLNGIKFNTLPWLFSTSVLKSSFTDNTRDPNNRLYAMGVDSFRLYPRLPQLEQRPGSKFYGQTGALYLSELRKVEREQVWAHIVDGEAQALPTVVSENTASENLRFDTNTSDNFVQ